MNKRTPLNLHYPDVLGQITGGPRINMEVVEVALGVYPKRAYLNQPVELVIVLQNMVNKKLQLKIAVRTPNNDPQDNIVIIEVGKPQVSFSLEAGEVGVLRMPIVGRPPTRPNKGLPVRVAIRYRVPEDAEEVRPTGGGAPPSVLSASPFKLQVLRDIEFIAHKWNESTDILTVDFGLAGKTLPVENDDLKPRYETLWAQEGLRKEIQLARAKYPEARLIARPAPTGDLYGAFVAAVEDRFARRGLPLHPGESMAIAKMMTYTVEDAPLREPDIALEQTRWFRALCQVLAANPDLTDAERNDVITREVFDSVLYDAVLVAFIVLENKVDEDLGDEAERLNYANRFMRWFAGYGDEDLTFVYLPLVLGGLSIARLVRSSDYENAWDLHDQLTEALAGRIDLSTTTGIVIFDMLESLLDSYQRMLRALRIDHPDEAEVVREASEEGDKPGPTITYAKPKDEDDSPPRTSWFVGREF